MTLKRQELEQGLRELDARMPTLTVDMNAFFQAFEDAGDALYSLAAPRDREYVESELLRIVQRAGVTPMDPAP
jgi:hypothetical protein